MYDIGTEYTLSLYSRYLTWLDEDQGNDKKYFLEEGTAEMSLNRHEVIQVKVFVYVVRVDMRVLGWRWCEVWGLWEAKGLGGRELGVWGDEMHGDKRVQGPFKELQPKELYNG